MIDGGFASGRSRSKPRSQRPCLALLYALLCLAACSDTASTDAPEDAGLGGRASAPSADGAEVLDPRPSIVLIVIESLRTDAVASYGKDRSSPLPLGDRSATPHLDALAKSGVRYAWAIAASSDSVTSHTSILTGLPPEEHGAGLWPEPLAEEEIETVAEHLSAAGYETVGFSENPMVGPEFRLHQGFERFEAPASADVVTEMADGRSPGSRFNTVEAVSDWLKRRDRSRPYFLFINLADPHLPYAHRENNSYMPSGVSTTRIKNVLSLAPHQYRICRKLPDSESITILAALYLQEVEAADRKLGRLVEMTRADAAPTHPPIAVITADHGTHFGEQRLLGHHFSVDNRAIRVPLVVDSGRPRITEAPGVIESPIAQHRIANSIRCWAGEVARCAEALPAMEPSSEERIVSIAGNQVGWRPPAAGVDSGSLTGASLYANTMCDSDAGLTGRNVAYFKGQSKFIWRQNGPDQLFDLRWDTAEQSDQILRGGETTSALQSEVARFIEKERLDQVHRTAETGPLRARAEAAYEAGRRAIFEGGKTATDAVWFAQLLEHERPDPRIASWIAEQIPLHEKEPFYPIIKPTAVSPVEIPEKLDRGVMRFTQYLLASVAVPEDVAMKHLEEYLAMDVDEYLLTHQLTALEWAHAMGRPLPPNAEARRRVILSAIAREHAADSRFRDLWVERAAFLVVFGAADRNQVEAWTRVIVDHHLGNGDWGYTASEIQFDGQTQIAQHPLEHIRGMAMIVLARYLATTEPLH